MEYLKPLEAVNTALKKYQTISFVLCGLLAISLLAVPAILSSGPFVIIDEGSYSRLTESKPWNLSVSRLEGFTKLYLSSRFDWNKDNFPEKSKVLTALTDSAVFSKLKDNLSSLEMLAKGQNARSFYVLEGFGYSQAQRRIEADVTRVIRIQNTAVATPLKIRIAFSEAGPNSVNPYGLKVVGVEETPISELNQKEGGR